MDSFDQAQSRYDRQEPPDNSAHKEAWLEGKEENLRDFVGDFLAKHKDYWVDYHEDDRRELLKLSLMFVDTHHELFKAYLDTEWARIQEEWGEFPIWFVVDNAPVFCKWAETYKHKEFVDKKVHSYSVLESFYYYTKYSKEWKEYEEAMYERDMVEMGDAPDVDR